MIIILESITFLFFLGILMTRAYEGQVKNLWLLSTWTSIILAMGIVGIWFITLSGQKISWFIRLSGQKISKLDHTSKDKATDSVTLNEQKNSNKPDGRKNKTVVYGKPSLNKFLESRTQEIDKEKSPSYDPTGVFIQSLEFQDANDVFLTGYVWQSYKDGDHDGISRGFILPEAIDPEIKEYYRRQKNNEEVIGWYFEGKLRQNFDYKKYPFDNKEVWLRLWHKDFDKNVILIPDFGSYNKINPSFKPGLEQDFVLPGWKIQGSFFNYQLNDYNVNFGIDDYVGQKNFPELYFSIKLQRDLLNIFINNLMVPIVIALLLFLVHHLILKKTDALGIVSACSGLLFIVILDQINLRGKILAAGILYLEYFYFILYLLIILVAINGILFAEKANIHWIQYRENLIPKLLYWPGILTLLLMATLFVFY